MDIVKPPDMTPSFSFLPPTTIAPLAHNRHKKLYDREAVLDWSLRDKHSKLLPLGNRAQSPLTGLGFDLWKGSRWAGMDTRRDGERRGSLGNRASKPWKGSRRTAAHPCLCRWPITKACLSTAWKEVDAYGTYFCLFFFRCCSFTTVNIYSLSQKTSLNLSNLWSSKTVTAAMEESQCEGLLCDITRGRFQLSKSWVSQRSKKKMASL